MVAVPKGSGPFMGDITPPRWAWAIRDALEAAGKEVEYFSHPDQGHALRGESWRLFWERVAAFLDQTL